MHKQHVLQDTFGYNAFRPLQESVIDTILAGSDVLLILPTGGGKSLCYQLPALLMEGVVVVVSPLLSLMHDQVQALQAKGVAARMLSSLQDRNALSAVETELRERRVKMLFVAPERLQNQYFLQLLRTLTVAFFAIDEAHCVSEWGHEFRADYRKLSMLKHTFSGVGIAAFTATATKRVEQDIIKQLQFSAPNVVRGAVYRENLFIRARKRIKNGYEQLLAFLAQHRGEQGIVYTLSRSGTEQLSTFLVQNGYAARAYHAGLAGSERTAAYHDFINDTVDIIVATIAFGMGIDKSNVRFVVHMSIPKTLESYYQEIGRAGRDNLHADVLLLYATQDTAQLMHFIAEIEDEQYKQLAYDRLNVVKKYAYQEGCRHQTLSAYFDDTMDVCGGACDNCAEPTAERTDITKHAQMFLSTVYRVREGFGAGHIIDILTGSKNKKVLANAHQHLSVYNIGHDIPKAQWRVVSDRLLEVEALTIGEFNTLHLTPSAQEILRNRRSVDMKATHAHDAKSATPPRMPDDDMAVDPDSFNALRALRREIATAENMPAYIIFDDKTLKEMAYFLPDTPQKFLQINGVGAIKLQKYGEQFLALLRSVRPANFIEPQPSQTARPEKTLHATHRATLSCIAQQQSVAEIAAERGLSIAIILTHINILHRNGKISAEQKQALFAKIPIDHPIQQWIRGGLSIDSLENLQQHLAIFKQLND